MQSKFKLLALVLLSTTFFLTSCGDSASNPTTPSNQVTDNSTNKPSVPSVNTDKKDDTSSDWYASEKEIVNPHSKKMTLEITSTLMIWIVAI